MNFDATHIAIRERSFAELLDLSLRLVTVHAGGLLLALVVGAAPWAVLNGLLLRDLADDSIWGDPTLYFFLLSLLMFLQTPIATAPITLCLGQMTFAGRVDAGRIARDWLRCLPQMILLQGVARALTGVLLVTIVMPYWLWPYLSELILLEQSPLWVGKKHGQTGKRSTVQRSKNLHRSSHGELFTQWIASLAAGALLLVAVIGGLYQALSLIGGYAASNSTLLLVICPAGAWLVVGFFAVVRFLAYLDLRIRREGWEVELKMRSEGAKLREEIA